MLTLIAIFNKNVLIFYLWCKNKQGCLIISVIKKNCFNLRMFFIIKSSQSLLKVSINVLKNCKAKLLYF